MHLGNVGASHEGLVAGAAKHHHAHVVVGRGLGKRDAQLVQGVAVQCVELVGAVDRDAADPVAVTDFEVAIRHGLLLRARSSC